MQRDLFWKFFLNILKFHWKEKRCFLEPSGQSKIPCSQIASFYDTFDICINFPETGSYQINTKTCLTQRISLNFSQLRTCEGFKIERWLSENAVNKDFLYIQFFCFLQNGLVFSIQTLINSIILLKGYSALKMSGFVNFIVIVIRWRGQKMRLLLVFLIFHTQFTPKPPAWFFYRSSCRTSVQKPETFM